MLFKWVGVAAGTHIYKMLIQYTMIFVITTIQSVIICIIMKDQ